MPLFCRPLLIAYNRATGVCRKLEVLGHMTANFEHEIDNILAYISDGLWQRAAKARKTPGSSLSFNNVPPQFANEYFPNVEAANGRKLWRQVVRNNRSHSAAEFWSHDYDAASMLCAFHKLTGEQFLPDGGPEGQTTYRTATGNLRLTTRGDLVSILPPLQATVSPVRVGPAKHLAWWKLTLRFTVGVVPANRSAVLMLHPLYPKYGDADAWHQLPPFAEPATHFMVHIQGVCHGSSLDRRSLAVQAALTWELSPDQPNPHFHRAADQRATRGLLWHERSGTHVKASSKESKRNVRIDNLLYRESRYYAALGLEYWTVAPPPVIMEAADEATAMEAAEAAAMTTTTTDITPAAESLPAVEAGTELPAASSPSPVPMLTGSSSPIEDDSAVKSAPPVRAIQATNIDDEIWEDEITIGEIKWLLKQDVVLPWVWEAVRELRAAGRWGRR